MFSRSGYSRALSAEMSEMERRLRSLEKQVGRAGSRGWRALEQQLERTGSRVSAGAGQASDRIGDSVASALSDIADRFRGGEAAKLGHDAAKLGNDALRRIADEVEHRPLVTLAIAAGVGFLAGLAASRH
jgi:ElaB/YqjD/DUF883 family membrane-anchored ribosome-binding protein